jgi:lipid A 3-O-deacylase PagL
MAQSEATRYSECDQAHNRPKRNAFRDLLGLLASLLAISAGWMGSFCWAESDATLPDARESLTRGTIEAGGAVGFWHEFLFPSESHSANREAVFIMPRFGMVVTDEVKAGTLTGNLEVLAEPGPGIQYFVTTRMTLTFGIRYSHISNAGLSSPNLGLDAILSYAGVSWFLPKY